MCRFTVLLLLVACTPTRVEFREQFSYEFCVRLRDCVGTSSMQENIGGVDGCVETLSEALYGEFSEAECPAYSGNAAANCLDGIEALSCSGVENFNLPGACDDVCL